MGSCLSLCLQATEPDPSPQKGEPVFLKQTKRCARSVKQKCSYERLDRGAHGNTAPNSTFRAAVDPIARPVNAFFATRYSRNPVGPSNSTPRFVEHLPESPHHRNMQQPSAPATPATAADAAYEADLDADGKSEVSFFVPFDPDALTDADESDSGKVIARRAHDRAKALNRLDPSYPRPLSLRKENDRALPHNRLPPALRRPKKLATRHRRAAAGSPQKSGSESQTKKQKMKARMNNLGNTTRNRTGEYRGCQYSVDSRIANGHGHKPHERWVEDKQRAEASGCFHRGHHRRGVVLGQDRSDSRWLREIGARA